MKKFLSLFLLVFLLTKPSFATGIYVGLDGVFTSANYEAINSNSAASTKDQDKQDGDSFNFGANAGFRFDFLNLFASAEAFYDNLDASARSFELADGTINSQDSITANYRYGMKANAGFAIFPRITPYLTYGMANVNYTNNLYSSGSSVGNSELAPIYGVGLMIDLLLGFSVRASYDYQSLNIRSAAGSDTKIKTHLGVAKLGVMYEF